MSQSQYFRGDQQGAPSLGSVGQGDMVALLDACLVNGYNTITLTSLVVASGIATATYVGHGMLDRQMVRLAGVTGGQTALNADWRITYLTADTFSFLCPGVTAGTASGTITAKVAPLGFAIAFTGTNQRAYRAATGVRGYLQVIDNADTYTCRVRQYESMSAVGTGTDPSPTNTQGATTVRWARPDPAANAAQPWVLFGDAKRFSVGIAAYSTYYRLWGHFGEFRSYKNGSDPYASIIAGWHSSANSDSLSPAVNAPSASFNSGSQGAASYQGYPLAIMRTYNGATKSHIGTLYAPGFGNYWYLSSGPAAGSPSPISGGTPLMTCDIAEYVAAGWPRGRFWGMGAFSRLDVKNNDGKVYKGLGGAVFDEVVMFHGQENTSSDDVGIVFPLCDLDTF